MRATPAAMASPADVKWRSWPSSSRRPPSGLYWPPRIFSRVLLPAPFSPSRPMTWPARASKLTPFSALTPGKTLLMLSNCSEDMSETHLLSQLGLVLARHQDAAGQRERRRRLARRGPFVDGDSRFVAIALGADQHGAEEG